MAILTPPGAGRIITPLPHSKLPPRHRIQPALVLDFDGTIRHSLSGTFISGPNDIALYPDVEPKIWEYRDNGYLIIGVTNQAGVAHGFKSIQEDNAEIQKTLSLFERNPFQLVYVSYHHPDGHVSPFNVRSLMRKPGYGMLALAEVEAFKNGVQVDWAKSLMVGDRDEDKFCAEAAEIDFQWASDFFGRKGN